MNKTIVLLVHIFIASLAFSQNSEKATLLLDEVSNKMESYQNMTIHFNETLSNEAAGIQEGDEPPLEGIITLQGEKYNLSYLGNTFIYDGKKLYVINNEEKEVTISEEDINGDDGFIYPSKLLTFYREGYNVQIGSLKNINGRKIQFIILTPIDSKSEIVKIEFALDLNTKHLYQLIQTGLNGSKTKFTITEFKHNQTLSNSLFSFDKEKYNRLQYSID
jgi:outer membrane lipoprotein-sorting protein